MMKIIAMFSLFLALNAKGIMPYIDSEGNHTPLFQEQIQQIIYQANLRELRTPAEIKVIQHLKDVKANAGKTITLGCIVGSNPTPIFHWLKNGVRVQEDGNVNIHEEMVNLGNDVIRDSATKSYHTIPCATAADSGVYKCVAYNGNATVESVANVAIEGADVKCPSDDKTAPRIVTMTEVRSQHIGLEATLICRTDRPSKFSWFHYDSPVNTTNTRFEVLSYGDLVVSNLTREDMGEYNCVASNEHGENKDMAFLFFA